MSELNRFLDPSVFYYLRINTENIEAHRGSLEAMWRLSNSRASPGPRWPVIVTFYPMINMEWESCFTAMLMVTVGRTLFGGNYNVIFSDEAHDFKNPVTTRA